MKVRLLNRVRNRFRIEHKHHYDRIDYALFEYSDTGIRQLSNWRKGWRGRLDTDRIRRDRITSYCRKLKNRKSCITSFWNRTRYSLRYWLI